MTNQNKCILIADDDSKFRAMLKSFLEPNYRIIEATDGPRAIDAAIEFQPDLILMDEMMPRTGGIGAARRLRDLGYTNSIHIITSYEDLLTESVCNGAGVTSIISKGVFERNLYDQIHEAIEASFA